MIDVYNGLLSLAKTAIDNNYSPAESIFYIYNIAKKEYIMKKIKKKSIAKKPKYN